MKRAFLKHIFGDKHTSFVSSMRQFLKNYNRMKSVFSAFLITAFATTFFIFNQSSKSEKFLAGDIPPTVSLPPLRISLSESKFCVPVTFGKSYDIKLNMHV